MNLILVVGEEAGDSEPSVRFPLVNVKLLWYCLHTVFSREDHPLLGGPVVDGEKMGRALEWGKVRGSRRRKDDGLEPCISHKIIPLLDKRPACASFVFSLPGFAIDRFVLASPTTLDPSQTAVPKIVGRWSSNCNARPDETMASSDTPAVKRAGRARNKRFLQPVVPALPQIPNTRKNHDIGTYHADHTTNGVIQETLETQSGRASPAASPDLLNGVHKDDIQEGPGNGTNIETDLVSAAPSPALQNGRSLHFVEHCSVVHEDI